MYLKEVAHQGGLDEIVAHMNTILSFCTRIDQTKQITFRTQEPRWGVPRNRIISTVTVLGIVLTSLNWLCYVDPERKSTEFKSGFLWGKFLMISLGLCHGTFSKMQNLLCSLWIILPPNWWCWVQDCFAALSTGCWCYPIKCVTLCLLLLLRYLTSVF